MRNLPAVGRTFACLAIAIVLLVAGAAHLVAQATSEPAASTPAPVAATAASPAATSPTSTSAPAFASPFSAAPVAAKPTPIEDLLAAESLVRSARSLIFSRSPQLATRLIALTDMAGRISDADPDMLLLLADIYQNQGKDKQAFETLSKLMTIYPSSHALGQRWLYYGIKTLDSATARLAMLQAVIDDKNAPDAIRAEACYRRSAILFGQGQKDDAKTAIYQTLQMDPWHSSALDEKFRGLTIKTPADRASELLGQLRGDPRNYNAAWDMGIISGTAGMYSQAVGYLSYTMMLMQIKSIDDPRKIQGIQVQYFNSVLDLLVSTKDTEGMKKLAEMISQSATAYPQNMDLQSLLLEAYQDAGQTAEAQKVVQAMKSFYDDRLKKMPMLTSDFAGEVAWFYICTQPDAKLALKYAKSAAEIKDLNPTINRILGIAELMSDDDAVRQSGEKRLKDKDVLGKETFAGVFLAEYYDKRGDIENRNYSMDVVAMLSRSGPAYRRLVALMRKIEERDKKEVKLSEMKGGAEVKAAIEAFDVRCLQVIGSAEKFVTVKLRPVRDKAMPGEPIELEGVLTNIGPIALPLGDQGLFNPILIMVIKAGPNPNQTFYNVPIITWQAPRYLAPGQSVTSRVRLDVGPLADYLDAHPLEQVDMEIRSLVDAEFRGQMYVSAIPTLRIEPVTLTRLNLLSMDDKFQEASAASWPAAYKLVLGTISQKSILRGEVLDRMLAARQAGALLSTARNAELNNVKIPQQLSSEFNKKVILAMMAALMKDKSPAVRAEAVASIPDVAPDQDTVNLIYTLIDDPSPIVRLRVLNKLCTMDIKGKSKLIDKFTKDSDEIIKSLAAAMANQ